MSVIELKPKTPKKFIPGDIVFFKQIKETAQEHGQPQQFLGHGFGILLGNVAPGGRDPSAAVLFAFMAQIGWVTFDDVKKILGEEAVDKLLKEVESRYVAPLVSPPSK